MLLVELPLPVNPSEDMATKTFKDTQPVLMVCVFECETYNNFEFTQNGFRVTLILYLNKETSFKIEQVATKRAV